MGNSGSGRHKEPKALKKAKGTHRNDRDAPNSPEDGLLIDFPNKPPETLKGHAITVWENAVRQLESWGILFDKDLADLENWAFNVGKARDLALELNKEGLTVMMENKGGGVYPIKNPKWVMYQEAVKIANSLGSQFGFNPSSMGKISVKPEDKKDDNKRFFG